MQYFSKCKPKGVGGGYEFVHYGIDNKRPQRQKEKTEICKLLKSGVDQVYIEQDTAIQKLKKILRHI